MRARTFTIPFSRLGDFPELDFEDATITVRPLYSQPATAVNALVERINDPKLEDESIPKAKREAITQQIICDLLRDCVVEWTLKDPDGKIIPVPKAPADLLALPAGLAGAFFGFFATYRGEGPNPTTGS
jgi:hypothetical protein